MATSNYKARKYCKGNIREVTDSLTVEEALQITINNEPFTVTMRTPGNDLELIRGLLYSEDIYTDKEHSFDTIIKKENRQGIITHVDLKISETKLGKGYLNSRNLLSVSSCGICGKKELEEICCEEGTPISDDPFDVRLLNGMFDYMNESQKTFKQSGGSHAAVAFDNQGSPLGLMEDIGRHNAVDKVIGGLIETNNLSTAHSLLVSGRVSYEIIIKCFRAKIPVLAAVSAPSTLAVDYAKELGITLFGFCRQTAATCYANPGRLSDTKIIETSILNSSLKNTG